MNYDNKEYRIIVVRHYGIMICQKYLLVKEKG